MLDLCKFTLINCTSAVVTMRWYLIYRDPDSENFSILEKFPIFVDLKLAGRKGREVDVAEVMAKHGGFKWSRTE